MTLVRASQAPSFFDRVFDDDLFNWFSNRMASHNESVPAVNIKEEDEAFEVELAAPGMAKEDFHIELDKDVLTISSEHKEEQEDKQEDERFTRREFSYQSFSRSFTLPQSADGDKIEARYDNGVLYIHIPKKEEARPKPAKRIAIN